MPFSYVLAVLVLSAAGTWWMVRLERRHLSSYSRQPDVLADWHALPTEVQRAHDTAVLDAQEAAERVVDRDALELELRAQTNAVFHP